MVRRTYPDDVEQISEAADLETVVKDKRAAWRAGDARARRRQRRYKNLLTRQFQRACLDQDHDDDSV